MIEILRNKKCETVAQLIEQLKKFDPNTPIQSMGPDLGGYDCSIQPYCSTEEKDGKILISHLEQMAYELREKGLITQEEYKEFAPH